jgi:hypothetical protein
MTTRSALAGRPPPLGFFRGKFGKEMMLRMLKRVARTITVVVPAKAGTQYTPSVRLFAAGDYWMPACAGMTG